MSAPQQQGVFIDITGYMVVRDERGKDFIVGTFAYLWLQIWVSVTPAILAGIHHQDSVRLVCLDGVPSLHAVQAAERSG